MTKPNTRILIAVGVLIVLSIAGYQLWNRIWGPKFEKDIKRSEQVDADHKVQTATSARVDTLVDTLWLTRERLVRAADRLHTAGDTAGQSARSLSDSSEMWKLRWVFRGFEVDTLRAALKADTVIIVELKADRARWKSVADSAVDVNRDLRRDLKLAMGDCHILPFVKCPSRKVVFIGAVTLTAVASNNPKVVKKLFTLGIF